MKNVLNIACVFLITGLSWAQTTKTQPSVGDGTSGTPYQISTLGHLSFLSQTSTTWWNSGKYYIQTVDIDAAQTQYWDDADDNSDGDKYNDTNDGTSTGNNEGFKPIGNLSTRFYGNYNGQNYKISNLTINRTYPSSGNEIGFFGYAQTGTIQNLTLQDMIVTATSVVHYYGVGMLMGGGYNGTISNITISGGSVSSSGTYAYVGTLVGRYSTGTISNCISNASVSFTLTGSGSASPIGGLIGSDEASSITNSGYTGNITIANSSGTVSRIGGFAGELSGTGTVTRCFSRGSIINNDGGYVGGFVGNPYRVDIIDCYTVTNLTVTSSSSVGGFFSSSPTSSGASYQPTFTRCFAAGTISGGSAGGFGGASNYVNTYTDSFWDTETTAKTTGVGGTNMSGNLTGKTTSEMKTLSTFTSTSTTGLTTAWDFIGTPNNDAGTNDYWTISNGYPYLAWSGGSIIISGTSGFRMMSSPVSGAIYSDLLSELWTQGMTGGDVTSGSANVWTYSGSAWSALTNLSTASLTAGQGFLVYVFSDTDFDGDNDLPVALSVNGTANTSDVTATTTYSANTTGGVSSSGWNLVGNPYSSTIDADATGSLFTDNTNFTSVVYVYDNATSATISWNGSTGGLTNGLIAPYQGFWVQGSSSSATSYLFDYSDCISGTAGTFYKTTSDSSGSIAFTITSGNYSDQTFVSFMTSGETGQDNADAWKLLPLTATERIVGLSYIDNQGLDINNLPYHNETEITIPIDIMKLTVDSNNQFNTTAEEATLVWDLTNLPESVTGLTLTNNITNETTDLLQTDNIVFTTTAKGSFPAYGSNGVNVYPQIGNSQFILTITYRTLNTDEAQLYPKEYALHTPYPNPFNPDVRITFDVPKNNVETMHASSLQVYNINGQRVETLAINPQPGTHTITWNPKNLSSGIYIIQLKTSAKIFNQKITYMK